MWEASFVTSRAHFLAVAAAMGLPDTPTEAGSASSASAGRKAHLVSYLRRIGT